MNEKKMISLSDVRQEKVSGNIENHLKTHTDKKWYCCSLCGKMFLRLSKLNDRMRTHTSEKPFIYSI